LLLLQSSVGRKRSGLSSAIRLPLLGSISAGLTAVCS